MKKLIKTLLLISTPLITLPMVLTMTSCTNAFGGEVRVYDDPLAINVDSRYGKLSTDTPGLKSLIYGTKKFRHGNYSLVFGSNTFTGTMGFLFNEISQERTNVMTKAKMNDSHFVKAISHYQEEYPVDFTSNDIGFSSYIDVNPNAEDPKYSTPFDKWSKTDLDFDEDKNKDGDWKREDKSAQEFRMFFDTMKILFGDKIKDDDIKTGIWAIYWKDGIPQKIDTGMSEDSYFKSLVEIYKNKK